MYMGFVLCPVGEVGQDKGYNRETPMNRESHTQHVLTMGITIIMRSKVHLPGNYPHLLQVCLHIYALYRCRHLDNCFDR